MELQVPQVPRDQPVQSVVPAQQEQPERVEERPAQLVPQEALALPEQVEVQLAQPVHKGLPARMVQMDLLAQPALPAEWAQWVPQACKVLREQMAQRVHKGLVEPMEQQV